MHKDQDLRKLIYDPQIPNVDLTGSVMRKLHAEQNNKARYRVKHKLSLLVAAGMLLMASTGFAMVQYHTLKNKQGEVIYQTKSLEDAPVLHTEEEGQRLIKIRNLEEELLQAGSAALFYIVPHNPSGVTDLKVKPLYFTDIAAFRAKVNDPMLPIMDSLLQSYTFKSAEVFFEPMTKVNPPSPEEEAAVAEKLREQAEESNMDYAMMPVELSDHVAMLFTEYKHGKEHIRISIRISRDDHSVFTSYWDEDIKVKHEKVVVNDTEMIYSEFEKGGPELVWAFKDPDSDYTYIYRIATSADEITKEDMIQLAELYMK